MRRGRVAASQSIDLALSITAEEVPLRTDEHGTVRVGVLA
jgi:hypothetical protein